MIQENKYWFFKDCFERNLPCAALPGYFPILENPWESDCMEVIEQLVAVERGYVSLDKADE